jgi:dihydroneopterin aldolase
MRVNLLAPVTIVYPPLNYYTVIYKCQDHIEQKTFETIEALLEYESSLDKVTIGIED